MILIGNIIKTLKKNYKNTDIVWNADDLLMIRKFNMMIDYFTTYNTRRDIHDFYIDHFHGTYFYTLWNIDMYL